MLKDIKSKKGFDFTMGEVIKKGASHFFKKAHDGFEAWVDFLNPDSNKNTDSFASRYLPALATVVIASGFSYEGAAMLINSFFDANITTLSEVARGFVHP